MTAPPLSKAGGAALILLALAGCSREPKQIVCTLTGEAYHARMDGARTFMERDAQADSLCQRRPTP